MTKIEVLEPLRRGRAGARADSEIETSHHAASVVARDMANWLPYRSSPDSALLSELDTIVARSDDLARNNGIAAGAERTLVDNVVGPRLLAKPNPDRIALGKDEDWQETWSRVVESKWNSFANSEWFDAGLRHTFHSCTRLVFRTLIAAGEAVALPLWITENQSRWKTALQLVDPARLSNPNGKMDSAELRGGIELNQYGAATAYHIRKNHPGDFFGFTLGAGEWERIEAYTRWGRRRVIHVYDPERIGQTRGKPIVTAVARQFKMFDRYQLEQLRQVVLDAMVFATLETPLDQTAMAEMLGGEGGINQEALDKYYQSMGEHRVQMKGGAVIPTPPGTQLKPFVPSRPTTAFDAFTTTTLRHIAAGMNMPYELVFKDFSKTNYSSARAAMLEAWRYFLACRQLITDSWSSIVFDLWFEEAVSRGEIPDCTTADFYSNRLAWTRCKWIAAGRGWVDPTKEAEAASMRLESGLSTLEDECAEQGKDWRDVIEQRAREQKFAASLGVKLGKVRASKPEKSEVETTEDDPQGELALA